VILELVSEGRARADDGRIYLRTPDGHWRWEDEPDLFAPTLLIESDGAWVEIDHSTRPWSLTFRNDGVGLTINGRDFHGRFRFLIGREYQESVAS
jgi:hypothetical protein